MASADQIDLHNELDRLGLSIGRLIDERDALLKALRLLHSEASDPARGFMPSLPCVAIVEAALAKVPHG